MSPTPGRERSRRKRSRGLPAAGRLLVALFLGLVLAALTFFALPFMQMVAGGGKNELTVREVDAVQAPPPPPVVEEEPPPEAEPEEPEPQLDEMPQQMSLGDLEMSLNPGAGGGTGSILNQALASAVQNRADDAFASRGNDKKPRPVYQVPPKYPAALRRQGIEGVVKVELVVDANGRVSNPRVVSSPDRAFEQPAVDAVRQWKFEAGVRGGKPAPFKILVPIRFSAA